MINSQINSTLLSLLIVADVLASDLQGQGNALPENTTQAHSSPPDSISTGTSTPTSTASPLFAQPDSSGLSAEPQAQSQAQNPSDALVQDLVDLVGQVLQAYQNTSATDASKGAQSFAATPSPLPSVGTSRIAQYSIQPSKTITAAPVNATSVHAPPTNTPSASAPPTNTSSTSAPPTNVTSAAVAPPQITSLQKTQTTSSPADSASGPIPGGFSTPAQLAAWCKANPDSLVLPGGYQGPKVTGNGTAQPWLSDQAPAGSAGTTGLGDQAFGQDPTNTGGKYGILKGIPYGKEIENAALDHNENPLALAKIAFMESRDNPNAPKGGLFQINDQWWRPDGYTDKNWNDPSVNANGAAQVLGSLYSDPSSTSGNGDTMHTIAVWNVGPEAGNRSDNVNYNGKNMSYLDEFTALDSQLGAALKKPGETGA